jgi:hypothetical protein
MRLIEIGASRRLAGPEPVERGEHLEQALE